MINKSTKFNIFYFMVIVVMLSISSCQSTPESNFVNQRNFKALLTTDLPESKLEYPETYLDRFLSKDGKVELVFDAKILVPEVSKFPIIKIDPQPIDKKQIQPVVDEFMEGQIGYYPESYLTKSEIESIIIRKQARINDVDALFDKYGDEEEVKKTITILENQIKEYCQMLQDAPENKDKILSNMNLRPWNFYITQDYNIRDVELNMTQEQIDERIANQQNHLYLVSDTQLSNKKYIRLIVYNELAGKIDDANNFGVHGIEHYEIHMLRSYNGFGKKRPLLFAYPFYVALKEGNLDDSFPELTINQNEAEKKAQEILHNLGINNFYLADARIERALPTYGENLQEDNSFENREAKFHFLTFKPMYYDIPLIHANNQFTQEEPYSMPFAFEEIKMRVSNNSIAEFRWTNPTDVTNVINENTKLLSFDEIIKIATNHMKLKYNLSTITPKLELYTGARIGITEIRLGLGGVAAYNSPGEYMLIPVWNFYGAYTIDAKEEGKSRGYAQTFLPFVSINAVDGSIIEQKALVNYE